MNHPIIKFTLISLIILISLNDSFAQQYGWRGPDRSGIYKETGLMKSWPESGPALIWEATGIGKGYSSVTVTKDAVYITGLKGTQDVLTAFSQTGKKLWEIPYGNMTSGVSMPETRCTATYFDGKLFVISGQGVLSCVSKEGKIMWSVDYYKKYEVKMPRFGVSESPLVVDNKVIATPGGSIAAMAAFDVNTGKVLWESAPLNDGTQYTNPLLVIENGKKIIITHSETYILAINANDGKLIWKFDFGSVNADKKGGKNYINTPIYRDGSVFAANGYRQTSAKIKVTFDGKEPSLVWTNPEINPHVGGMVLVGDYIYSSTHDSNSSGRWICVDWKTGKTMWATEWKNKGSVIYADGMLYMYEEKFGNIALVKPSGEKLDIVSSFQVQQGDGPYWSHPVIDNGRLFLRHGDYMAVYNIKGK